MDATHLSTIVDAVALKPGDFVVPRDEVLPWKHGSHEPWKHGFVIAVCKGGEQRGPSVVMGDRVLVLTNAERLIDESLAWMAGCTATLDSWT